MVKQRQEELIVLLTRQTNKLNSTPLWSIPAIHYTNVKTSSPFRDPKLIPNVQSLLFLHL